MDKRSSIATILVILAALSLWFIIMYQSWFTSGEFDIYLTKDSLKVVAGSDIQYYNASSHELILTNECAERLKTMGWQLSGNFTMVVNGKVALNGVFVPPYVSRSYPSSQVVILYPTFRSINYEVMKIQMGYPWDQPSSPDPRQNPRIIDYFKRTGKLIR